LLNATLEQSAASEDQAVFWVPGIKLDRYQKYIWKRSKGRYQVATGSHKYTGLKCAAMPRLKSDVGSTVKLHHPGKLRTSPELNAIKGN
jgi:hypothetical protein